MKTFKISFGGLFLLLFCQGCTVVSANRVFPKITWYWSADAKAQRNEKQFHRIPSGIAPSSKPSTNSTEIYNK